MPNQPAPTEDDGLLKPAEFARLIRRSRATAYRLINSGAVETVTLPVAKPSQKEGAAPTTGAVRIPVAAYNKFVAGLRSREAS